MQSGSAQSSTFNASRLEPQSATEPEPSARLTVASAASAERTTTNLLMLSERALDVRQQAV